MKKNYQMNFLSQVDVIVGPQIDIYLIIILKRSKQYCSPAELIIMRGLRYDGW